MNKQVDRREFVKKAVYVTPAVLSLAAAPQYAKAGSIKDKIAAVEERIDAIKDKIEEKRNSGTTLKDLLGL